MKNNDLITGLNVIQIDDVNQISYSGGQYTYGNQVLDPKYMVVRTNLKENGPVIYANWNDAKINGTLRSRFKHPVRRWYAVTFGCKYMDTREITLKRWYKLNQKRKEHSDTWQK